MKIPNPVLVTFLVLSAWVSYGQGPSQEMSPFKEMVDGKNLFFHAQSCSPMKGGLQQLSPGYTFAVVPDSVISDLPYFGRVHMAPMNPSDAGIRFTSVDFQYSVKDKKKGGWDITIKSKDVRNHPQIYLSISPKGTASVRISCSDRDPISFNGYIESSKRK